MNTTLNLELFKPWFIFEFKWNKHLVVKDYPTGVLVINLDWDDCELLEKQDQWIIAPQLFINQLNEVIYKLNYADILETSDNTSLLIEEDFNN